MPLLAELGPADRVNAAVLAVEPPLGNAVANRLGREAKIEELRPGDDIVLSA